MGSEHPDPPGILVGDAQTSEVVELFSAALGELRTRWTHYFALQAKMVAEMSTPKKGPRQRRGDQAVSSGLEWGKFLSRAGGNPAAPLADALLFDNGQAEHVSPATAELDDQGTLTLARELPDAVLILEISYVDQVNPIWNLPNKVVVDLRGWLNRQYLGKMPQSKLPKLNTRAETRLDRIWEMLVSFQTNNQNKAAIIQATPVDLGAKTPIVRSAVIFKGPPTQIAKHPQQIGMPHKTLLADNSHKLNKRQDSAPAGTKDYQDLVAQSNSIPPKFQALALEAEMTRSKKGISREEVRLHADQRLYELRTEANEWKKANKLLPNKSIRVKRKRDAPAVNKPPTELPPMEPNLIESDSIQQASDLADDILQAAGRLVAVVESHSIIRPGVTNRTLCDLQMAMDILEGTARDIENEPVVLQHQPTTENADTASSNVQDGSGSGEVGLADSDEIDLAYSEASINARIDTDDTSNDDVGAGGADGVKSPVVNGVLGHAGSSDQKE